MEELELTFLPKYLPEGVFESPHKDILDIYIPHTEEHPVLRLRKSGDKYEMTKKSAIDDDAAKHHESTITLSQGEYEEMARSITGKRSEKTRYYYEEDGVRYEVGVFKGALEGLVLVDVEFATEEEMKGFRMPSWCLQDVTYEDFAAGGLLCGKSYKDIEPQLRRLGYEKMDK